MKFLNMNSVRQPQPLYVMHDLQYHCYSYSSGLLKAG